MSNFPIVRAKSSVCLPREREVHREANVATLSRVTSVPNLGNLHVSDRFRSSTLYSHRLDRNSWDDHYHDRYTNLPSLHWSACRYNARRFPNTDPIPHSGEFGYPGFWQRYKWYSTGFLPTFKSTNFLQCEQFNARYDDPHSNIGIVELLAKVKYSDFLSPDYWRRYRDPYYTQPLWSQFRPHLLDSYNTKRAIKMYRQGLISFDYLDKKWIEPTALGRRHKDWDDVYTKGAWYGPRRYFYQFAA
ncbi:hypothetical protein M3Y95_00066100 [Aphelenchoides besseyi]|nr:hypothetical protein M3Y95_00066100 [Aphelenchoides besseyi]